MVLARATGAAARGLVGGEELLLLAGGAAREWLRGALRGRSSRREGSKGVESVSGAERPERSLRILPGLAHLRAAARGKRSTSRFQRCETSCLDCGRFSSRGIHFIVPNSENDCPDHWEMRSIFSKTERAAKSLRERRMRSAASGGRLAAEREGARSGRMAFLAR